MEKKILLVDDEPLVLKTLRQVLREGGYDVETATNGLDALLTIREKDIGVFFLDLKMPDMDGIQLCREIKAVQPQACVYALTGYSSEYHIDECRKAGFDDYFIKPFKIDKLLDAARLGFEKYAGRTGE